MKEIKYSKQHCQETTGITRQSTQNSIHAFFRKYLFPRIIHTKKEKADICFPKDVFQILISRNMQKSAGSVKSYTESILVQ